MMVVTGGTGFVGSAVTLELLRRTDDEIMLLVRPRASRSEAVRRVSQALAAAARRSGDLELVGEIGARVHTVVLDMLDGGWHRAVTSRPISHVWHFAASLAPRATRAHDPVYVNTRLTRNAVQFAQAAQVGSLVHCSTAFVAADSKSAATPILERRVDARAAFRNEYERSKLMAEEEALAFPRATVVRPSVVIGHSVSGMAGDHPTGIYPVMRALAGVSGAVGRDTRLHIRASPDARLSLIPVDVAARNIASVGLREPAERIFHITNNCDVSLAEAFRVACEVAGLAEPVISQVGGWERSLGQQLHRSLSFQLGYLDFRGRFDTTNTQAACGAGSCSSPMSPPVLARYLRAYLEQVQPGTSTSTASGYPLDSLFGSHQ